MLYFSYFCSKHRLWYSLEQPRRGGSNEYSQSMFWAESWKISEFFIWFFFFFFFIVKFSVYLNRHVFVMLCLFYCICLSVPLVLGTWWNLIVSVPEFSYLLYAVMLTLYSYANYLLKRKFAWNVKDHFLEKIMNNIKMSSAQTFTHHHHALC